MNITLNITIVGACVATAAVGCGATADAEDPRAVAGKKLCDDSSVIECTAACDGGNADACMALATTTRVAYDERRTFVLWQQSCKLGLMEGCDRVIDGYCPELRNPARGMEQLQFHNAHNATSRIAASDCVATIRLGCAIEIPRRNYANYCFKLAGLTEPSDKSFAFRRWTEQCAGSEWRKEQTSYGSEKRTYVESYVNVCGALAGSSDAPIEARRFALERICHSPNPEDACGRLKDLALP